MAIVRLIALFCGTEALRLKFSMGRTLMMNAGYTSVMIVPTGIGASIGGFAGDALPSAKLLSSCVDTLVTHPNVLNGAMMYWPLENTLYVEGYALDEFAGGAIGLAPTKKRSHVIGLLLDKGIEESLKIRHLQAADAARATLGINVAKCLVTDKELGVETSVTSTGASWGSVNNIETLVDGARRLVQEGCTAIAVIARFPEEEDSSSGTSGYDAELFDAYRKGEGVDAIAGVEALISHAITKHLGVPCAHAPAFSPEVEPYPETAPKAAAEELGYTFLPCVLANLHRAPQLVPLVEDKGEGNGLGMDFEADRVLRDYTGQLKAYGPGAGKDVLTAADVDSVIVPHTALGGSAVLSLLARGALVIAVGENESTMQVSTDTLLLTGRAEGARSGCVVQARSYTEAAGIVMAHKHGILLESLTSHVPPLRSQ